MSEITGTIPPAPGATVNTYHHDITHLAAFLTFVVVQTEQWDFEPGRGTEVADTDRPPVLVGVFVRTPSSSLRLAVFWPHDIDPLVLSRHISALEIEESFDGVIASLVTLSAWLDKFKPVSHCSLADLMAWPAKWQEVMDAWQDAQADEHARPLDKIANDGTVRVCDMYVGIDTKEKREQRTALVRLTSRLPLGT